MLKAAKYVAALILPVATLLHFTDPFSSDFDKFSKGLFKERNVSAEPVATPNVLHFLSEHHVDDPATFFQDNMNAWQPYKVDDPETPASIKTALLETDTQVLRVYSGRYFDRLVTHYELRVLMWEKGDGNAELEAYVLYHSL